MDRSRRFHPLQRRACRCHLGRCGYQGLGRHRLCCRPLHGLEGIRMYRLSTRPASANTGRNRNSYRRFRGIFHRLDRLTFSSRELAGSADREAVTFASGSVEKFAIASSANWSTLREIPHETCSLPMTLRVSGTSTTTHDLSCSKVAPTVQTKYLIGW